MVKRGFFSYGEVCSQTHSTLTLLVPTLSEGAGEGDGDFNDGRCGLGKEIFYRLGEEQLDECCVLKMPARPPNPWNGSMQRYPDLFCFPLNSDVGQNKFSGSLPSSFSAMTSLNYL